MPSAGRRPGSRGRSPAARLRRVPAPRGPTSSSSIPSARPHTSDPMPNSATPARPSARMPHSRPSRSAGSSAAPSTTAYTPSTAATPATSVSNSVRIGGRASATIAVSARARKATPASGRRVAPRADAIGMRRFWLGGRAAMVRLAAPSIRGSAACCCDPPPGRLRNYNERGLLPPWTAAPPSQAAVPKHPSARGRRRREPPPPINSAPQWICEGCAWGSGSWARPGAAPADRPLPALVRRPLEHRLGGVHRARPDPRAARPRRALGADRDRHAARAGRAARASSRSPRCSAWSRWSSC